MFRSVRSSRTRFFIGYPMGPLRPRRQRQPAPGHDAAMTAGSQPTETMGPQLPSLIAATIELTATNAPASAANPYHHRMHGFMASLPVSSELVIDKLTWHPPPVRQTCHRR